MVLNFGVEQNENFYKLKKGLTNGDLFIYSNDDTLFIIKNDIRMFKVSFNRLEKTINKSLDIIFKIIVKNINDVHLYNKPINSNKFFLSIKYFNHHYNTVFKYNIKLKEIDDYLKIYDDDKYNDIIYKQYEKINILLDKIKYYESEEQDILTDEEFL